MKKVLYASVMMASLLVSGCQLGKPAYEDVKVDKKTTGDTRSTEAAGAQNPAPQDDPIARAEKDAGIATPQQQAASDEKKPPPVPEFLDMTRGQIKDLPPFPKSTIVNVQYGPVNGASSAMYVLQAKDSPETVSAFYEKAFKSNGWKIVATNKEPDSYEYNLAKGTRDEALVRIKKDPQTRLTAILLSRAQSAADQPLIAEPATQKEKKK